MDAIKDYETRHEGRKKFPYKDSNGKITIGLGRNLTDDGLSDDEIDYLFSNDKKKVIADLITVFPNWASITPNRQMVLFDMRYQCGLHGFLGFHDFIAAVRSEDWEQAGKELVDSELFRGFPNREQENLQNITKG
jgi:lysozyme